MITSGLFSSKTPEWATPQDFFDKLDEEFHFDLDVCATDENAKCSRYFTKEQDGLSQQWGGSFIATLHMGERLANGWRNAQNTKELL